MALANLQVSAIQAFNDNYIWLIHAPQAPSKVLVVDPGDAAPVLAALDAQQLTLRGILATHHHRDHVGGIDTLLARVQVPVFGPASETIPGQARGVRQGEHVQFAEMGLSFEVLDVPGHTAGHIAYVGHGALFCGDTLFSAGCGRLFEGTAAQMTDSLQKFAALPMHTAVYCGHEYTLANLAFAQAVEPENPEVRQHLQRCGQMRREGQATVPSSISRELKINPFLRLIEQNVKRAAETHAGRGLDSDTEVFAVLRDWKNHFVS